MTEIKLKGSAENTYQEDRAAAHEIAFHLGLSCPKTLDLRGGNVSEH